MPSLTRAAVAIFLIAFSQAVAAQTTSTLCQAENVRVASGATTDLRLIGCGEGFPDNLLWNLDRADSISGALDSSVTRTLTGKGAVVYMCDTGVMSEHDEFQRATGSVVIGGIQPQQDRDCDGHDAAVAPCFSSDVTLFIYTHGTATASVVAGRTTGVAPDAKIVSVDMNSGGSDIDVWLHAFDLIIRHAWDPTTPQFGTGIINMSFVPNYASVPDPRFAAFEEKMKRMIGGVDRDGNPDPAGKRFLFVTVAGNETPGTPACEATTRNSNLFPGVLGASIDGLITVGGIDETNHIWVGSCRGPDVDVLAPAAHILVASISGHDHYRKTFLNGETNSGTSYAAPFVAGLAALLLERNPDYTPQELESIIKATSSRVANADEPTAYGRVAMFDVISRLPRRRAVHH